MDGLLFVARRDAEFCYNRQGQIFETKRPNFSRICNVIRSTLQVTYLNPALSTFIDRTSCFSVPSMYEQWDDVSGVSMKSFSAKLRHEATQKPLTETLEAQNILADSEVVCWVDLREVTHEDTKNYKLKHLAVATKPGNYQGICLWFACNFPSDATEPVTLSTEPEEPETHWKQTTIVLPSSIEVEPGAPIAYEICLKRSDEAERRYDIQVTMLDPEEMEHPEYCTCYMTKCILVRAVLEKYEKSDMQE